MSAICRSRYGRQASTSPRLGRAVAGRPALEDVGDVDVLAALHSERRQHVVEELPGLSDEGLALRVLLGARRLADEQPFGADVAHAGHRLLAGAREAAGDAGIDVRGEVAPVERGDAHDARFGSAPALRLARGAASAQAPARPAQVGRTRGPDRSRRRHVGARPSSLRISSFGAASARRRARLQRRGAERAPHDDRVFARIVGRGAPG